jgi:transposase
MRTQEDQLEIAFLKREGLSFRQIARRLGCTPRTAKKYAEHPELIGKRRQSPPRGSKVDPFRNQIAAYLEEDPEYRATTIYDRLKRQGFEGGYAIVQRAVKPLREQKRRKAYVRFETEPGAQAQVDFGEFQVQEPDGTGTTVKKYYLFALILGYSRMLYAELLERCDMASFLEAHQRAFQFLGGTPLEILYDRMRNVFLRQLAGVQGVKGKVEFTQSLVDLATHYGFTPRVAPAYAPWVKGKVERPMDFVRESFWRGYAFTDLETANRDLAAWLSEKSERVHGTTHERVDARFVREKPHLLALPPSLCDVSERLFREVRKDCTIPVYGNRYVVEHTLVGRKVLVRLRGKELRVFDDNRLVVTYAIPEGKGQLVQDPRFYAALRADRELQARKFSPSSRKSHKSKGRAVLKTISPLTPKNPIDVSIEVSVADMPGVQLPIEVERRSILAYAQLGGEVSGEVGHA